MEQLEPLETIGDWEAKAEKLRLLASAHAGFNIDMPCDLSELGVDHVSCEGKEMYSGYRYFELTTKLRGHHVVDEEECEVIVTIVRKSVKRPILKES